jgi:predicted Zn-dependent protease with MMP-like domain|tara:strand:+ start:1095 stop:1763 length:669 start_codon:yes stop_codon:yes gene_type:complete
MIKKKNNFLIMLKKEDEDFIDSLELDKMYQQIKSFFNSEEDINPIRLCLVYSPEEFIFFSGRDKLEKWIVGQVTYPNKIIVFSPSVVEKCTIHKKEDVKGIIAHEISHLFYGGLKHPNLSVINEGIATYFKYQFVPPNFNIKDFRIRNEECLLRGMKDYKKNYFTGYFIVDKILSQEEGRDKLFKFLSQIREDDDDDDINKKFNIIFGIAPKEFIEMKGGNI